VLEQSDYQPLKSVARGRFDMAEALPRQRKRYRCRQKRLGDALALFDE
jgi:hypothetical protein